MLNSPQHAHPGPDDIGDPFGIGIAYYRSDKEFAFHLRALQRFSRFSHGRLVVVLGVRGRGRLPPDYQAPNVRLILTCDTVIAPKNVAGWVEPDPLRAVDVAITSLQPEESVMLLLPADWNGPPVNLLIEHGRQCCANLRSAENRRCVPCRQ